MLNILEKLLFGILGACLLFMASMVDSRPFIPQPDDIIDCKVGAYTFSIMRKDCHQIHIRK